VGQDGRATEEKATGEERTEAMIYKRGKYWHLDVTVYGIRYRESLFDGEGCKVTDRRAALNREKERITEIQTGKGASKVGRDFARKAFRDAAKLFQEERALHVSERTRQFEKERLRPLEKYFGERTIRQIKAGDIGAYQRERMKLVAARTVNMEVSVLRRILKRAKLWNVIAEDVRMLPEHTAPVARVLTPQQKRLLFEVASTRPDWLVAYCAGVLAVSTTCRGVELKHLQWRDVDLFKREFSVERSKTQAGHRTIPLNGDAMAALARLLERARSHNCADPDHFVFPTCEHERLDPTRPQKSWRTAWRALLREAGKRAGREAAKAALEDGGGLRHAFSAWRRAASPFKGFRFHDLRHQAITELAESGASDATLMALAGHMSRRMLEHYSHVRMAAKRTAVDNLDSGLMRTKSNVAISDEKTVH
jgi:integrase